MSLLRFKINDYHAINHADIKIDGITVLAGENGSGKSTLSRWIFYLINSMSSFEETCYFNLFKDLNETIIKFHRLSPDTSYRSSIYSFDVKVSESEEPFDLYLSRVIDFLQGNILSLLQRDSSQLTKARIKSLVKLSEDVHIESNPTLEDNVKLFFAGLHNQYMNEYLNTQKKVQLKRSSDLYELIATTYYTPDDLPGSFSLFENEVLLVSNNCFTEPYFINKALYIDSSIPSSSEKRPDEDAIAVITRSLMMESPSYELDSYAKNILVRMNRIINGTISLQESSQSLNSKKELRYKRYDGLDIPLRNAASGIQAIAYLYRLLECGFLDSETLLLIDEPETHLHPQWVVEYANILVHLHKDLGVKIIIASHSPDMISAIETISRRHELEDVTRFYQAKQDQNLKYTFEDLETNIAGIFESFNVAFSKMQDYGAADL